MNSAVIVAGGAGSRFGVNTPKQFLKIGSRELLSFSVDTFTSHPQIDEVIIVCHADWLQHVQENYPGCIITPGRETRTSSVKQGIRAADTTVRQLLIHDAARPFISHQIITDCLTALQDAEAAAPCLPLTDSIVQEREKRFRFTPREQYRRIQTPQCFSWRIAQDIILNGDRSGTDEIGLVLQVKPDLDCHLVPGSELNFKITSRQDFLLAKAMVAEGYV